GVGLAAVSMTTAEAWNGSAWSVQPTPSPVGALTSELAGTSCISSTSCEAVGLHLTAAGAEVTLAEVWNGTSWSVQPTPNPSGALGSSLSAVSCASATACIAVGSYFTSTSRDTLAEVWNGTA